MADIKPFRAIRPGRGMEEHIAALPYDVYSTKEARAEVAREPHSFLRIDRAETQFGEEVAPYAPCVYEKAGETLWRLVADGELIEEEKECYYLYEQTMDGRAQIGIAACASVDDYLGGVIRKHENTRSDKEEDRVRHVKACHAQTGPIFLTYRSDEAINEVVERSRMKTPVYDFTPPDGVRNRVWIVDDERDIRLLREAFCRIEAVYIADGHHRCASAVRVASEMREAAGAGYTGGAEFNYFLSVLFPDNQLLIMDYNRVLKDLNGYTKETLLARLSRDFTIRFEGKCAVRPKEKGTFGLYLGDSWYRLTGIAAADSPDAVERLDVSILQNKVLGPVFGISDPKTDERIDFVGGIRGTEELERRVHTDCLAAFSLCPTSLAELFAVADAGKLMPPKSTWFEPKLRSGLFVHRI